MSLIKKINEIQDEIEVLNKEIEKLGKEVTLKEQELSKHKDELLKSMIKNDIKECQEENLFANVFSKVNIGYSSDADVLNKLKGTEFSKFIKTKVTESLDKTPLKKEIKVNKTLEDLLKPLIVKTTTTYVTVTTEENHKKMLEHIEKGA